MMGPDEKIIQIATGDNDGLLRLYALTSYGNIYIKEDGDWFKSQLPNEYFEKEKNRKQAESAAPKKKGWF